MRNTKKIYTLRARGCWILEAAMKGPRPMSRRVSSRSPENEICGQHLFYLFRYDSFIIKKSKSLSLPNPIILCYSNLFSFTWRVFETKKYTYFLKTNPSNHRHHMNIRKHAHEIIWVFHLISKDKRLHNTFTERLNKSHPFNPLDGTATRQNSSNRTMRFNEFTKIYWSPIYIAVNDEMWENKQNQQNNQQNLYSVGLLIVNYSIIFRDVCEPAHAIKCSYVVEVFFCASSMFIVDFATFRLVTLKCVYVYQRRKIMKISTTMQ